SPDGLRHGGLPPRTQIISVSVLTDQERQLQLGKMLKQAFMPMRRTLGTRRVVASIFSSAWITETDREDRNSRGIIEGCAIQPQPVPQAIAARIIPGYPILMDLAPWRLTDDQKPSGVRQLYNGSGTERQFCLTDPTGPNFAQQTFQRHQKPFKEEAHVFPRSRPPPTHGLKRPRSIPIISRTKRPMRRRILIHLVVRRT